MQCQTKLEVCLHRPHIALLEVIWPHKPSSIHSCLSCALKNPTFLCLPWHFCHSLGALGFLLSIPTPVLACPKQNQLAFLLRKQHLETSGDDTSTPSITSGATACRWPLPFSLACPGSESVPGEWLWEGPGRHREQLDRAKSVTSRFWL